MMARAVLAVLVAALVTAPTSAAKEGVEATLVTPIPLDAEAGEELSLAWRLVSLDENGGRVPFGASGVYVALFGAADGEATTGFASGDGGSRGRYEATIVVPEGGIAGVQIALMGWANGDPAPVAFPITNDPLPPVADDPPIPGEAEATPTPAPPVPTEDTARGRPALWGGLGVVAALALAGLALLVRRRRRPASA